MKQLIEDELISRKESSSASCTTSRCGKPACGSMPPALRPSSPKRSSSLGLTTRRTPTTNRCLRTTAPIGSGTMRPEGSGRPRHFGMRGGPAPRKNQRQKKRRLKIQATLQIFEHKLPPASNSGLTPPKELGATSHQDQPLSINRRKCYESKKQEMDSAATFEI